MLAKAVFRPLIRLTLKPVMRFANVELIEIPSKFEEFKTHLEQMEKQESMIEAARIMAECQNDQEIYKQQLEELEEDLRLVREDNGQIVQLIDNMKQMSEEVEHQVQENHRIE